VYTCTQACTAHGRVRAVYSAVFTPRNRPCNVLYAAAYTVVYGVHVYTARTRPWTRPIHGRVHRRVHMYTARPQQWTRALPSVYTAVHGRGHHPYTHRCTRPRTRPVHGRVGTAVYKACGSVHGPCIPPCNGCVPGRVHGRVDTRPRTRPCRRRVHGRVAVDTVRVLGRRAVRDVLHGRVHEHDCVEAVYPCVHTARVTAVRPCTRPAHSHLHSRVHVYTACRGPCARVDDRVHGLCAYTSVYTAVYTCIRPWARSV